MKYQIVPPLAFLALVLLLWQGAASLDFIPSTLLPSPVLIIQGLQENSAQFQEAFLESSINTLKGFALSALLGVSLAISLSLSPYLRKAILPFAIFFQTVPIIAIAPLLVIYFGFGAPTVIAASFIVSIFPVLANTISGLDQASTELKELLQFYGANRWQKMIYLLLPSAVPSIYTGLKVAAGLSIIGTVAGEFVAGSGLGALIDSGRTQQRVDWVFGALILLSFLGLMMMGLLKGAFLALNSRRPYDRASDK